MSPVWCNIKNATWHFQNVTRVMTSANKTWCRQMDVPELLTGRLLASINYDETRMSRVIGPGLDGSSFARWTCRMSQTAMMFVGRKIHRTFSYDARSMTVFCFVAKNITDGFLWCSFSGPWHFEIFKYHRISCSDLEMQIISMEAVGHEWQCIVV
jgi:hypothetical protein